MTPLRVEANPMSDAAINLPSFETLLAEREQLEAQIAQGRELIAKSRARIAEAAELFADSFDKLAESQKLIRRASHPA